MGCQNGETYEEDGHTYVVAESACTILMMCTVPCVGNYMQMVSQCGGTPEMCSAECKGIYSSFPSECSDQTIPGSPHNDTLGQMTAQILQVCIEEDPCVGTYMQMVSQCDDTPKMCSAECKDNYSSFPSECSDKTAPSAERATFGQMIAQLLQKCTAESPTPAP